MSLILISIKSYSVHPYEKAPAGLPAELPAETLKGGKFKCSYGYLNLPPSPRNVKSAGPPAELPAETVRHRGDILKMRFFCLSELLKYETGIALLL